MIASDDLKSATRNPAPDSADLLALQLALLVHHLIASRGEVAPSTPFAPVRSKWEPPFAEIDV